MEKILAEAPISCDGEPAPDRVVADILAAEVKPLGRPKGDRMAAAEGSLGDVLVGEPERGWPGAGWAKLPIVKCSDLAVDIINYVVVPALIRYGEENNSSREAGL